MASLFQLPNAVPVSAGNSYASAKLHFYQAGTTTNITTYTTSALSVAHANPVVADANGVFAPIYINEAVNSTYRIQLKDSADVLLRDVDNIPALPSQANIGATLWPRTAAEISASVTPTNYAYEPGNVLRYFSGTVGSTDATTAIQAACDQAAQAGGATPFDDREHYIAGSSKIVIKSGCEFSKSIWNIDNAPAVAVEVSTGSATNPTDFIRDLYLRLPILINSDKPGTGWAGQGTGIRLVNLYNSQVYLQRINGFDIGLLLTSYGTRNCAYNNIFVQEMENNKRQIVIKPSATTSAVNENNFYGGSCLWNSGEGTAVSGTRGALLEHFSGGNIVNNNRFWGTAFEGDVAEYFAEIQGINNYFTNCRWEATGASPVYLNGTPISPTTLEGNVIWGGYANVAIATTTAGSVAGNTIGGFLRRHAQCFISQGWAWSNASGDGEPVIRIFPASVVEPWEKASTATDWLWEFNGQEIVGKNTGDAEGSPRVKLNAVNGEIHVNGGRFWRSGSGSPEGVITAPVGSLYSRTDGGAATSFYVKESGSGNTGWVAK